MRMGTVKPKETKNMSTSLASSLWVSLALTVLQGHVGRSYQSQNPQGNTACGDTALYVPPASHSDTGGKISFIPVTKSQRGTHYVEIQLFMTLQPHKVIQESKVRSFQSQWATGGTACGDSALCVSPATDSDTDVQKSSIWVTGSLRGTKHV